MFKFKIHKYINKFVSNTKKIEIPSTPSFNPIGNEGINIKV